VLVYLHHKLEEEEHLIMHSSKNNLEIQMISFTAFLEIQLNPGMRDIGDSQWAKLTHRAAITHTHAQRMSPIPLDPSEPPIPLVLGFNRVFRKAVKRI
jgi:hypothetical protein